MPARVSEALVLQTYPFKESDLVVSILTRGRVRGFGLTPLYDLVVALIKEALPHATTGWQPWPQVEWAYNRLLDRQSAAEAHLGSRPGRCCLCR